MYPERAVYESHYNRKFRPASISGSPSRIVITKGDFLNDGAHAPPETEADPAAIGERPSAGALATDDWQWPAPKDWQKLERICHLLFRRAWNDPKAQLNGRPGQQQQGVDVFGTPTGGVGVHGVQCKRKDVLLHTLLTEDEVLAEVENAKAFKPPLVELTIVTCTASDGKVQLLAREISERHAAAGLFRVDVLSWTEITARLAEHSLLGQVFNFQPASTIAEVTRAPRADQAQLVAGQVAIQQQLAGLASKLAAPTDGPTHAKLDACRVLLEAHSYRTALGMLETIRDEEWERADARLRFRIATNLGAAHLGLHRNQKAGRYFLEAFDYDKLTDKALANRSLGYLLLDRPQEAAAAAREAIAKHPLNANTWTAHLNVIGRVEPDSPLPDPPTDISEDPTLLLVRADMLALRKAWDAAEVVLRKLLTLPRVDPIVRSRLAEVLMSQATEDGEFYFGASYSPDQLARFQEARILLRESWDKVKGTELAADSVHVVNNACALATVLGEMYSAEEILDEGLLAAAENASLWSWKVRMCAMRRDAAGASRAFARLPADVEDRAMLEATVARSADDPARAANVLEAWIHSTPDPDLSVDARSLFADSLCEGDLEHAEARFNALPEAGEPTVARSTAIFARSLRAAGREAAAATYLTVARAQLAASMDGRDQLLLADALADFDEHAAAVAIYEKHVSIQIDTLALREYIRCLFTLDQRRRLADMFAQLPAGLGASPPYEYYRAHLALRVGDFPTARAALERCLATAPEKLPTRIMWADVCMRLDDPAPVSAWLKTVDPTSSQLTVDQLLQLGPILHHLRNSETATRFFYAALRRFPQDPRTHLAFTASVMFKGSQAWLVAPAVVVADTAVTLRDEGGHERTYLLEDRAEAELQGDEVSTSSDLGRRLLGHRVGEVIVGHSSNLATHQSTLVSIQHKFVHAARESMNAFNTRFPESPGLVGVKLPTSGTPEEQLAPILQSLKDKSSRSNQIMSLYSRGMPLAAMGVMMGLNSIEAWQGLSGRADLPIRVCDGTHQEREAAFVRLRSKDERYLIDPIALVQLQSLNALSVAERVCGQLAVAQATLEELRAMLSDLDLHPDGYLTMFERDGQYYRHQVSAKAVAGEKKKLQSALDWARAHCEIVSAVPKVDPEPDTAEGLEKALGHSALDTLLAAQGGGFVLLTDDFHLRKLARGEFGIEGIWIQAVLMLGARELGVMKLDHYNRAVSALAAWRHHFTTVSADQLSYAAARARWRMSGELQSLVDTLPLAHIEIQSNVRVVALFLKDLWRKGRGPTKGQARTLTQALLKAVDPGKSPHSAPYFHLLQRFANAGIIPSAAWNVIVEWYRAQFLLPLVYGQ